MWLRFDTDSGRLQLVVDMDERVMPARGSQVVITEIQDDEKDEKYEEDYEEESVESDDTDVTTLEGKEGPVEVSGDDSGSPQPAPSFFRLEALGQS